LSSEDEVVPNRVRPKVVTAESFDPRSFLGTQSAAITHVAHSLKETLP
jgi:hypothetical protein